MFVLQDGHAGRVGLVRRGDGFAAVNRDQEYHALRGRGAAFFCLPLVDAGRPARQRLEQAGVVELSSAAGYYWMQAHLFVTEHPYYARTDRDGSFRLEHVPSGTYELVCWMPSSKSPLARYSATGPPPVSLTLDFICSPMPSLSMPSWVCVPLQPREKPTDLEASSTAL